jgi:hypothetical protein
MSGTTLEAGEARGALCAAIAARELLTFEYAGLRRVVAPYCHGVTARGEEVLRGVQVRGQSRSRGFGFGKLWTVAKMSRVTRTGEAFVPDDPDYNPADRAMARIHCCV